MAEIVNLRQTRKRLAREAAAREAAENRTRYGLTKGEKAKAGSERARILDALDGARLVGTGREDVSKAAEPSAAPGKPDA